MAIKMADGLMGQMKPSSGAVILCGACFIKNMFTTYRDGKREKTVQRWPDLHSAKHLLPCCKMVSAFH